MSLGNLTVKNIVVIAHSFNPSIFTQYWFIKHGLINEEAFLPTTLFTPQLVQVVTTEFEMLVIPDQIQFKIINQNNESVKILIKIISILKETPFVFLGINFNYFKETNQQSENHITKDLFYNSDSKLYQEFANDDARFGVYLSKNSLYDSRLKLEIKPTSIKSNDTSKDLDTISYAFNFHFDLKQDEKSKEIVSKLDLWNEFDEYAHKVFEI